MEYARYARRLCCDRHRSSISLLCQMLERFGSGRETAELWKRQWGRLYNCKQATTKLLIGSVYDRNNMG